MPVRSWEGKAVAATDWRSWFCAMSWRTRSQEVGLRHVVAGEGLQEQGAAELAVHGLEIRHVEDGLADLVVRDGDAEAGDLRGEGLLGDEFFERLAGDLGAELGGNLGGVRQALRVTAQVGLVFGHELGGGDVVSRDGGDGAAAGAEVADDVRHAPGGEGHDEDDEEDPRGPGAGEVAE